MPITYDGSILNDSDLSVTLSTAGAVIIEGFTTNRPTTAVQRRGATGLPAAQKFTSDFETASGTIQFNGTKPIVGETFVYDTETWIVTQTGEVHTYSDYGKCPASFAKKYN